MNPASPGRIFFGHAGVSLESGQKTGLPQNEIREGFLAGCGFPQEPK